MSDQVTDQLRSYCKAVLLLCFCICEMLVFSRCGSFVTLLKKYKLILTHLSLASLLWDIGKQTRLRCDAAERGVPSGAILFALKIFIEKLNKI